MLDRLEQQEGNASGPIVKLNMFIFYLDESYDSNVFVLTAMRLMSEKFRETFTRVKDFRRDLNKRYGLYVSKELHATEFVAGRGNYSPKALGKYQRVQIFGEVLAFVAALPDIEVFNVRIQVPSCPVDPHLRAFERMLNRIQASLDDYKTEGLLILDEGKEGMLRRISRQMTAINWIPSKYGSWGDGSGKKNITLDRLIEDPLFKASHNSYFLQLADTVAFSLLKREVAPTPRVTKYGLDKMFDVLKPVLCLKASASDPFGVVRG